MTLNNISLVNYPQNQCKKNSFANSTNVQCVSFAGETENQNKFKLPDMNKITVYTLILGGIANLLTLVKALPDTAKKKAGKIGMIATVAALVLGGGAFIQSGRDKKQPNETLAGLLCIGSALPFLKGKMLLFLGVLNIGLGNFSLGLANRTEKGKTLENKSLAGSIPFIIGDFVRGVKSCGTFLKQSLLFAIRKRKELPDIFTAKPNADQRRVSGILLTLGGLATVAAAVGLKNPKAAGKVAKIGAAAITLGTVGFNVGNYILNEKINTGVSKDITRVGILGKQLIEILQIGTPGSFLLGYSKMLANASAYETLSALNKFTGKSIKQTIPKSLNNVSDWHTRILANPSSYEALLARNKYSGQPANK
jgi:hypothetical protein